MNKRYSIDESLILFLVLLDTITNQLNKYLWIAFLKNIPRGRKDSKMLKGQLDVLDFLSNDNTRNRTTGLVYK